MEIGTHIQKNKSFSSSLKKFFEGGKKNMPVQMFSGSPKFWRRSKLTKEEIAGIQKLQTELSDFITQRTLQNKMDLAFFKKIEKRASG